MRRRPHRHPVLETAVFTAALLLAVFIGRELWRRRGPAPVVADPAAVEPIALHPTYPPLPAAAKTSRTETAVSGVAPIKLTRVQRRRPKSGVVPAPK